MMRITICFEIVIGQLTALKSGVIMIRSEFRVFQPEGYNNKRVIRPLSVWMQSIETHNFFCDNLNNQNLINFSFIVYNPSVKPDFLCYTIYLNISLSKDKHDIMINVFLSCCWINFFFYEFCLFTELFLFLFL